MHRISSPLLWLPGIYEGWRYQINEVLPLNGSWYIIRGVYKDDTYKSSRTTWEPDVRFDLYVHVSATLRDLQLAVWRHSTTLG